MQPRPPALDPHGSATDLHASSQANALRESQSTGALNEGETPKPRKSYAGKMKNGKFERTKAESVEDMSKEARDAILADIEENRQKKMQAIKEKSKKHDKMKKQYEQAKHDHFRSQMDEAEALEEDRRKKKVKELKKWLKQKEAEDAAKKARDAAMMQEIVEKETQKAESLKKVEEERKAERERRLQANERAKAKLEQQLLASREAATNEKKLAVPQAQPEMPQGPPELVDPRMQQQQMLIQQQKMMQQQQMQGYPMAPAAPQRVVHRHIHHHVHYHEGGEDGQTGSPTTDDDKRRIEMQSEDRIRQQLEEQEMGQMSYGMQQSASMGRMLPPVDYGAETPTSMQRAASMGQMPGRWAGPQDGMRMTQTQQAFRQPSLPPVDAQELGRRNGVPSYGHGVQKAIGTYANSGRPTFVKKK